jgi:hypothetical protein
MTDQHQREQQTESAITVRQVTAYQASWTEEERGAPGAFTIQLILDSGAEEDVLLELLNRSESTVFDLERGVLIFGDVSAG